MADGHVRLGRLHSKKGQRFAPKLGNSENRPDQKDFFLDKWIPFKALKDLG
jgi:hypothetical protein